MSDEVADIGIVKSADTMYMRHACGEAENPETGLKYEISANVSGYTPIVRSLRTGKYFVLPWQHILALAIDAGIDEDD